MAAYDLPGADFIPGLTAQDYSLMQGIVGEEASLLDYTPPNVQQWGPPLIPLGENVFENFVKTSLHNTATGEIEAPKWRLPSGEIYTASTETPWYPGLVGERIAGEPDLLQEYNRRYSRPLYTTEGKKMPGSLMESTAYPGQPETMAEFGERKYNELKEIRGEPIGLYPPEWQGPALYQDIHQQRIRNPYLAYSGEGTVGRGAGAQFTAGRLPQPDVEGYEYAYPIYAYGRPPNEREIPGDFRYAPTGWDVGPQEADVYAPRFTTNLDLYPYFPYMVGDPSEQIDDSPYITVGQTLIPKEDIKDQDWFWI